MGFNKVFLLATLDRITARNTTAGGASVCEYSISCSGGTTWRCKSYAKIADYVLTHVPEGKEAIFEGRLEQDDHGSTILKMTRVNCDN